MKWIWDILKLFMYLVERPGEGDKKKAEVMELMDELYGDWRRIDAPVKTCHSVKEPRQEALWVNYEI